MNAMNAMNGTTMNKPSRPTLRSPAAILSIVSESVLIGLLVGVVITLLRLSLGYSGALRERILAALPALSVQHKIVAVAWAVLIGLLLGFANMIRPLVGGGGVSQVKGILGGRLGSDWRAELPLKWVASFIAISAGLSLGWEGPSVMLGLYTGLAVLRVWKRPSPERRTLLMSSTAAGVSAAFSAPLSGVVFALEEMGAAVAPLSIACSLAASAAADLAASRVFGLQSIYRFGGVPVLPLASLPWVALFGAGCALLGIAFKRVIYVFEDLFAMSRLPTLIRPVVPAIAALALGLCLFGATGSGHTLIEGLPTLAASVRTLAVLLAVKLLFTGFCAGSGASGGIFLPFLSCGALAGAVFAKLPIVTASIGAGWDVNFIVLGMAGMFAAVVGAPVTGIVLVLEMTGSAGHLLSLVTVSLCARVVTSLVSSAPVYDAMLTRLLKAPNIPRR